MELLKDALDIFLHLDVRLAEVAIHYGPWIYVILFGIIFLETGVVIFPLLPGDSLLFAAGALASTTVLDVHLMVGLLIIAAIAGDSANYSIGKFIGPRVFHFESSRFFNKDHLIRTHEFYERHGGITIVIARFMPIIRTFAPFVAGIGTMTYHRFLIYNIAGGVLWVSLLSYAGYFFGNLDVVRNNFSLVILMIVFLSILPGLIAYLRDKIKQSTKG
ncbi:MAG: DedA family protein [Bacteroidetes bacterium]|nr:DedA family protein [Bacteroidota bacterium]